MEMLKNRFVFGGLFAIFVGFSGGRGARFLLTPSRQWWGNKLLQVAKNKIAPPFRVVEMDILFGTGIDTVSCLLDAAEDMGIFTRKGSWYSYNGNNVAQVRFADDFARNSFYSTCASKGKSWVGFFGGEGLFLVCIFIIQFGMYHLYPIFKQVFLFQLDGKSVREVTTDVALSNVC